ncbi:MULTISPECIES: hypothetical protein [Brachybacterium]|uniref:hypothetical protein n=1 Tax=Brachybacterium TaxID=43668 RepID=UPI000BB76C7C|nr:MULTISPECIES: hypothetical protein [Brachybacterium]PCC35749.1 hypothetical protein CIK71_02135 [Brachybacterium alimentarium]RCS64330.1 hypothetical protein CIK81_09675 [Brachybacterium sp. JB7]
MAKKNSLDDMRDEAYRRQDNLASDIDELVDRVNPKNAVTRWKNELVGSVKGFSEAGDEKSSPVPLTAVVGGVIGVVVLGAGIAVAVAASRREPTRGEKLAKTMREARRSTERSAKKSAKSLKNSSLPRSKDAEKYAAELGSILQDAAKNAEKKVAASGR